ncbi:Aux/IAA-ARF-dimerization [Artemisia annua]|uniref:Auxin-responsive protein n=1 Tax=Artemisia annua TaxID=35608 RepID=A0A2U1LWK3_ARTAN|nr:Aux/IAA-ARF-dimerization [Artemisia annua]
MSNVTHETTADREDSNDDYDEMELTLALPGESRERKLGTKRQFSDVVYSKPSDSECSESDSRKHVSKERVVGWPPVRSYRKNTTKSSCKYVKVAVDGAPYLRKVNLESYTSYEQLLCAFEDMFSCFTILNEKMTDDHVNRSEHVPTYEDKDGDWMLVGDVPWKMFVETCKRIRLMKNSEAINQLDPRTLLKSSNNKSSLQELLSENQIHTVRRCRKHQKDKRCHAIKMCKTIRRNVAARIPVNEKMTDDHVNRSEHVPTYEDKDGDWMLVGDVPWKMFVETCKRIRLMKNSEAINQLDPRTLLKSSNNKSSLQELLSENQIHTVRRCRKHQKDKRCHAIKMCKTIRRNVAARIPASTHCFAVAAAPRDVKDVWTVIVAAASSPIPLMLEIAVRTFTRITFRKPDSYSQEMSEAPKRQEMSRHQDVQNHKEEPSTHCFAVAAAPRDVKDVWTVIVAAASSPIPLMLEIAVRTLCLKLECVYGS